MEGRRKGEGGRDEREGGTMEREEESKRIHSIVYLNNKNYFHC